MAEFCKECFIRIFPGYREQDLTLSADVFICEVCGEVKPYVLPNDMIRNKSRRGLRIMMNPYDDYAKRHITDDILEAIKKKF